MKRQRLLGIMLIVSSLLLPVGYAASFNTAPVMVGNTSYEAGFEKVDFVIDGSEEYILTEQNVTDGNSISFTISNLYPGANFTMKPMIKNYGLEKVKIKSLGVEYTNGDKTFFDLLRGYDATNKVLNIAQYNQYLDSQLKGKVLNSNETMQLSLNMGLSSEISEMQNAKVGFKLTVLFEQAEVAPAEDNNTTTSTTTPANTTPTVNPGPEVNINEEAVPGGATPTENLQEPTQPEVNITDEEVPGGPAATHVTTSENLPKTGGIGAGIIYAVAAVLLIVGIMLCRKREVKQ